MKSYLPTLLFLLTLQTVLAQKTACGCFTKDDVNALWVEGSVTYKGTSKVAGHTYDVVLNFKNESKCTLTVGNVLLGSTIINPKIILNTEAKNRRKNFTKTLQISTLLQPFNGLDDILFAELTIDYKVGAAECSNYVTVLYKNQKMK